MAVQIKRAYDPSGPEDGYRVLVDRLWPRGMSKDQLKVDDWLRDIAPSGDLRRWFGHDPGRWLEFRHRYRQELQGARQQEIVRLLAERAAAGTLTLVCAARDDRQSNAAVLKEIVEEMVGQEIRWPLP